MTDLALSDRPLSRLSADAVVIGTAMHDESLVILPGAEQVLEDMGDGLPDALRVVGATGAEGEVVRLATLGQAAVPLIVAVGLGTLPGEEPEEPGHDAAYPKDSERRSTFTPDHVRKAAGAAARGMRGRDTVAITLASVNGETEPELVTAVAEGIVLGGYQFTDYRSEPQKPHEIPPAKVSLLVDKASDKEVKAALQHGVALGEAVSMARDLVNTPPSELYPESFAAKAKAFAGEVGIKTEILDERQLHSGGYGGILAVGSGSDRGPRLVRLTYSPSGVKKGTPQVALVGKGITFDSGGISLKPGPKMDEMKTDMSGAAAVVSAIVVIAALKLPIKVIATVPLAENLPSGSAYRPADIVTHRGGKRAEILNTDAEGRVVLGDAIARACEDAPDYLIETSTLTGAQVVALGKRTAGVMGSDEFRDRVAAAGNAVGELAWPMPLPPEVRKGMDSKIADFANIGDGPGGMLAGGHYLKEFIADGVQWAHIDIAGPSNNTASPYGYTPEGGTGVPVRTIVRVVEDLVAR